MHPVARLDHGLRQAAKVGYYTAQYIRTARRAPLPAADEAQPTTRQVRYPGWRATLGDIAGLVARDQANIGAGLYPRAATFGRPPFEALAAGRALLRDLDNVNRRRGRRDGQEIWRERGGSDGYPRYYVQNFHYQTDGYLSPRSAALYDTQVETLFAGSADLMRRQALPPLVAHLRDRPTPPAAPRLADLGCGTGGFLHALSLTLPAARLVGVDLSPDYLAEAKKRLGQDAPVHWLQANAERTDLAPASFDAVTSVYLFHELPRKARANVAAEAARLLKPGGIYVHVDTIQTGDHTPYDDLLAVFPVGFHEPYYLDYIAHPLDPLMAAAGLAPSVHRRAFLSKVSVYVKR